MDNQPLPNPAWTEDDPAPRDDRVCSLCSLLCNRPPDKEGDDQTVHIVTEREIQIVRKMALIRTEASELQRRLLSTEEELGRHSFLTRGLGTPYVELRGKLWIRGLAEDMLSLSHRLRHLGDEWEALDRERRDAAAQKMRMLELVHRQKEPRRRPAILR